MSSSHTLGGGGIDVNVCRHRLVSLRNVQENTCPGDRLNMEAIAGYDQVPGVSSEGAYGSNRLWDDLTDPHECGVEIDALIEGHDVLKPVDEARSWVKQF